MRVLRWGRDEPPNRTAAARHDEEHAESLLDRACDQCWTPACTLEAMKTQERAFTTKQRKARQSGEELLWRSDLWEACEAGDTLPGGLDLTPILKEECSQEGGGSCAALGVLARADGQETAESVEWHSRACTHEFAKSCEIVGQAYEGGDRVEPDQTKAAWGWMWACKHREEADACIRASVLHEQPVMKQDLRQKACRFGANEASG